MLEEFVRPPFAASLTAAHARLSTLQIVRRLGTGSIGRCVHKAIPQHRQFCCMAACTRLWLHYVAVQLFMVCIAPVMLNTA